VATEIEENMEKFEAYGSLGVEEPTKRNVGAV
jgi:hypothetical protein